MGTDKRARQKAGRQARIEAAQAAAKKAETKRRITSTVAIVAFVVVVGLLFAFLTRDKGKNDKAASSTTQPSSSQPSSSLPSSSVPAMESAAGKPCVAFSDQLPEGAPDVPIEPGTPPTELVTKDLKEGSGDAVQPGATVTVNYIGVSCSTGKIFDSSWSRGTPATFPLDGVIKGWTDGIPGMKPGGQRLLIIPPDQGYGPAGSPPKIAPDETLYFVVDLISSEAGADTSPAGTQGSDGSSTTIGN